MDSTKTKHAVEKKIKNKDEHIKNSWFCRYNLLSVTLIAFGISSLLFLPDYIHKQMMFNLELRPDSRTFSEWKKPTVQLYLDVYIFNWTNPEDIKNASTKPILHQLGPYRFRDYPDKHNITFHENSTVSYKKSNIYYFVPEMSNGTMDDVISGVNLLALGAGHSSRYWNAFKQYGVSTSLNTFGQKIHVVKSAREMLFDGYADPLMTIGSWFSSDAADFDTVGYMVKKNATDRLTGKYTVHTGVGNISELGKIKKYNDKSFFPHYQGECRKLKGSPGEFYPPGRQNKEDTMFLFTPEMCRSLPYEYDYDKTIHGLTGNRYTLGQRAVDNGQLYNENKCYFQHEMSSGVWNMSACAFNNPIFMSYPHFYMADQSYIDAVEGLSPQQELHESYMTLDEKLSITLETTARFQTNVMLDQFGSISLYKNVPKILMPLFFIEHKFIIGESDASQLYYGLLIFNLSKYAGFVLIFLGTFLLICRRLKCCNKGPVIEKNLPEACALVIKENTV
ncbi:unnamed protein product [Chironomus riparius]|uniref:Uncharacterized protein n=1 Tax=Chironomus riparius TaxID=315576 RepID=A0A9N9WSI3_9DIPT|nr:unnamed protein product [Chironomus riparius]